MTTLTDNRGNPHRFDSKAEFLSLPHVAKVLSEHGNVRFFTDGRILIAQPPGGRPLAVGSLDNTPDWMIPPATP